MDGPNFPPGPCQVNYHFTDKGFSVKNSKRGWGKNNPIKYSMSFITLL
jgi:hypothetical protein